MILWIDRRKASKCIHGELSSTMAEQKSKQRKREREREREINKGREKEREKESVFGSI